MKDRYRTVFEGGEGRYEEKKSVFLSYMRPVSSEEEAAAFVESLRKKHRDARHVCSAWVIGADNPQMRASDDGEPQGTAGRPILDILTGAGLADTAVAVVRYFGGVLLGTGGLARAYTASAQDALRNSVITEKILGAHLRIGTDYNGLGRLQYMLASRKIPVLSSEYGEDVRLEVILPAAEKDWLQKEIAGLSAGKAAVEDLGNTWYMMVDGECLLA